MGSDAQLASVSHCYLVFGFWSGLISMSRRSSLQIFVSSGYDWLPTPWLTDRHIDSRGLNLWLAEQGCNQMS